MMENNVFMAAILLKASVKYGLIFIENILVPNNREEKYES